MVDQQFKPQNKHETTSIILKKTYHKIIEPLILSASSQNSQCPFSQEGQGISLQKGTPSCPPPHDMLHFL
ncbi:hypothetical protein AQUCO_00400491v1 [Aquilegia coerulea]|uniref:Uncharacterized protein n=1 Tax=Aquilegia coerulea TaxID=218851 RepID=A0A2G5EV87_AQUCA|nr:hypothetical protein AQUCO_00400491v1 [Aquilegia coerulea]